MTPLAAACIAIVQSTERMGMQDGRNIEGDRDSDDPTRCLVLLLRSRRVSMLTLIETIATLRQHHMPSKEQIAGALAGGKPLTKRQKGARLTVPVLEAQIRGDRRWCAGCLRLTPDKDLAICSGCYQVGYCLRPKKKQLRVMWRATMATEDTAHTEGTLSGGPGHVDRSRIPPFM